MKTKIWGRGDKLNFGHQQFWLPCYESTCVFSFEDGVFPAGAIHSAGLVENDHFGEMLTHIPRTYCDDELL